jgi:hypothetical protein
MAEEMTERMRALMEVLLGVVVVWVVRRSGGRRAGSSISMASVVRG